MRAARRGSTSARSSATARGWPRRPRRARLCAVVKADGYGHGAVPAARAALAGGAAWLAVATAAEAAELRAAGHRRARARDGRALPGRARAAVAARRRRRGLARGVRRLRRRSGRAPGVGVHVKLDTGMGRLGTRDADEATRVAEAVAARRELRLAGAMTHFATADERRSDVPARAARALHALGRGAGRAPSRRARPRRQLRRHAARAGGALRHGPLRDRRSTAWTRSTATPPPRPRAGARAAVLRRRGQALRARARAPATAAASSPERETWLGTIPIGYGDGVRRALTNNADVLVGGRRVPLVGTVSMDNITVDLGGDAPSSAATRRS